MDQENTMATRYEHEIPEGYEARIEGNKVIFELKESEDEKIRKMLVKQMERWKKCAEDNNVEQDVKDASAAIAYLEKQKEQKPAEIDEYKIIKKHITEDSLSSEVNKRLKECGWYVTYDKPAEWSEEDEKWIDRACMLLNELNDLSHLTLAKIPSNVDEIIAHIRSLRPHPHWEPSEDEERLVNTSISFLKDFADKGYENAVECIDWLKSKINGTSTNAK